MTDIVVLFSFYSSPMIPKSCLTKLGDHRNNEIANKQKKDESFMVAWKELLEIIEFIEKTTRIERKDSVRNTQPPASTDAKELMKPCHVAIRRLTSEQLATIEPISTKHAVTRGIVKPCRVALRRLTSDELKLSKPPAATTRSHDDVIDGPLKPKNKTNVDKIAKATGPVKMATRNDSKKQKQQPNTVDHLAKINKYSRNKENE